MEVFPSIEVARESDEVTAYLAGRNGIHLYSEFGAPAAPIHFDIVKDVVPSALDRIEEGMEVHHYKSIPMTLISRIIAIFKRVYQEHHAEFIVMLEWDSEKKQHILGRPKFQTIGPSYLKYDQQSPNIGTVHSHCDFGASFSSTDDANEKDQPGIYLVIGNLMSTRPSMVGSITGCGNRYHLEIPTINPAYLSREISEKEYAWWMETCQIRAEVESKTYGFFMLDAEGDILCWRESKWDLEPLMGPGNVIVAKANLDTEQARMRRKVSVWQNQNVSRLAQEAKDRKKKDEKAKESEKTVATPQATEEKEDLSDTKLDDLTGYAMQLANGRGRMQKMFESFLWRTCEKESEVANMVDSLREMMKLAETQVVKDLKELEDLAEEAEIARKKAEPSGITAEVLHDPYDAVPNGEDEGNISPMSHEPSCLIMHGETFGGEEYDIHELSREDWGEQKPDDPKPSPPEEEVETERMCPACEYEDFIEVPECTESGDPLWVCLYCGKSYELKEITRKVEAEELDLEIEEEDKPVDSQEGEYDEEKPICPNCRETDFERIGNKDDDSFRCKPCGNELFGDDVIWVPVNPTPMEPACPICVSKDLDEITPNNFRCKKCDLDFLGGEMIWVNKDKDKEEESDDDEEDETAEVVFHCRMCADEVKRDAELCPHCGEGYPSLGVAELEDLALKKANEQVKEKYVHRCMRCKEENHAGTKHCRVCRWEFPTEESEGIVRGYIAEDDPIPPDTYIGNCSVCESSVTAEDIRNGGCRVCSDREREDLMLAGPSCTACKEPISTKDVQLGVCPFCAAQFTMEVQPEWTCPDCQGRGCIHCDQKGTVRMFGLVDPDGDDDDEGKAKVRIRV